MSADYFDAEEWHSRVEQAKANPEVPAWLVAALEKIGERADEFPPIEDEARFVVEFVYPH